MMAVVSSHILNSVDGSHAGGIKIWLVDLFSGEVVFETVTDEGGRMKQSVTNPDLNVEYELVFDAGAFWAARGYTTRMPLIALRFRMPEPDGTYHSPIIMSPNGYSVWASA